ncbi:unnamed protein product, partial [Closterium sp. Yama58-4]
ASVALMTTGKCVVGFFWFESMRTIMRVIATGIHDTDVKRYVVDIPDEGQPTWSQLPSIRKPEGAYFSGFEVSFDFHGVVEDAALRLYELIGMVTVLQSQTSISLTLGNFCNEFLTLIHDLPSAPKEAAPGVIQLSYAPDDEAFELSRLERFKAGVLQSSLFEREHGSGSKQGQPKAAPCVASGSTTHRSWNLDCVASYEEGSKDEITVKVFKDWSPVLDGSSFVMTLSESKFWSGFGISIADAAIHSFFGILHTEKSYMEKHLNIYLHLHSQHISSAKTETVPRKILLKLVKDAVIASLQQLKTQLPGEFSSIHQAKVGSCLPDLATSIAAIVADSSNPHFQEECSNILAVEDVKDVEAAILQRLGPHSLFAMSCHTSPSSIFSPSSLSSAIIAPSSSLVRSSLPRSSPLPRQLNSHLTSSSTRSHAASSVFHGAFDGLHRQKLPSSRSSSSLSHSAAFHEVSDRQIQAPFLSAGSVDAANCGRRAVVTAVFERFTERAIKAVMMAQAEAKVLGRKEVATEQLLLGLIAEDFASGGKPGGYLGLGMTIRSARGAVGELIRDGRLPAAGVALVQVEQEGAALVMASLGVQQHRLHEAALARLKGELDRDGRSSESITNPSSRPSTSSSSATSSKGPSSPVRKGRGKKAQQSALEQFCTDLTAMAVQGGFDPVIGREAEVARVMQILARRTKSNPLLLGEPGVGKTAIAEGLALRIAENDVPQFLQGKRLLSLDMGRVMAGAKERGELELRVTSLVAEAVAAVGEVILVIDEVHTMVGAGAVGRGRDGGGSGLDISNLLKPALSRGQIQCIATTTTSEFRKHMEKDKALARRFQPVTVDEPSEEAALAILHGLRPLYEAHHKCILSDSALAAAVTLSARYIPDRCLPDKAIDLIDEAASRSRVEGSKGRRRRASGVLERGAEEYWREIRMAQAAHEAAHARQNPFTSLTSFLSQDTHVADTTTAADAAVAAGRSKSGITGSDKDDSPTEITAEHIAAVAAHWTGIPLQQLSLSDQQHLAGLEEALETRVVGQGTAVRVIARAVQRARVGLKGEGRPVAALLFSGPTGVGKTELCKALAAHYYGSEDSMIRLDMSEYMERHAVNKLIGAPPGYVGYGEGGKLTEAVRRWPFCLILLDEIEKAHPDVFNLLLQIFEDGRLTDSQGRHVSFKNALIVLTSNVGSQAIARGGTHRIGFLTPRDYRAGDGDVGREGRADAGRYAAMKEVVMEELKAHFRPELMNRIDEVVVFRALEREQIRVIASMMVKESADRLALKGINLEVSEALMERICEEGYDRAYGARPLRRAVTRLVDDPISEAVLAAEGSSSRHHRHVSSSDSHVNSSDMSESLPSVPSVLLPVIAADAAADDVSKPLSDVSGVREGAFTAGDTALVDVGQDGEPVVIRLPRPDVCEMGLCLPFLKLPAPAAPTLSLPD